VTDSTKKPGKPDEAVHHEIGDDKGEGGQKDIKTDSVEASHAADKGQVKQG
jgi:predicted RNase H-related nuclease YkuK (DUF458 family)